MLIRISMDKLLTFFVIRKFPGPIVLQKFKLAYTLFPLVLIIKVIYMTHSFETRRKNIGYVSQPHGPSLYTLSMIFTNCLKLSYTNPREGKERRKHSQNIKNRNLKLISQTEKDLKSCPGQFIDLL